MRGSGKTTVGRALADRLGVAFVDTDEQLARNTGHTITELFQTMGEREFRRLEGELIKDLCASPPPVIAVGGGAVLDRSNIETLRRVATLAWLRAPVDVLCERIAADPRTLTARPPLSSRPLRLEMEELLVERLSIYQSAAEIMVDTGGKSPEHVRDELLDKLRGREV
jgi:shikimate kinase